MTNKEKQEKYRPHIWHLYENGHFIDIFFSHKAAKRAKHFKTVQAYQDFLDFTYTIKRID